MKIVADQELPLVSRLFSALGDIQLAPGREIDNGMLRDCDLLLIRSVTKVDHDLLRDTSVRYVASATSGVDHVDQDCLRGLGVSFIHAPGCNAQSVCEYVLSSLFCLQDQFSLALLGKRVGIVGYGHVGSLLARYLRGLGFDVLVYDPFIRGDDGEYPYRDLEGVLAAEVVTLHASLTDGGEYPSRGMCDADWFSRLRGDVVFINSARGGIVEEGALRGFLADNPAAHAVLDVWADEPHVDADLLRRASIATPHIAGYSMEAKYNAVLGVYERLVEVLPVAGRADLSAGLFPAAVVERPVLTLDLDDDLEAVKMAVLGSYDARGDSAALRAMLELDAGERADFFDTLRAEYPIRREFSHLCLRLPERPALRAKLAALGFSVTGEGV